MRFKSMLIVLIAIFLWGNATYAETSAISNNDETETPSFLTDKFKDPNKVLAIVAGTKITLKDLQNLSSEINSDLTHLSDAQKNLALLRIYINLLLLSKKAQELGYDKTKQYATMLNIAKKEILEKIYLQRGISDKISDRDIKARYNKEIASLPKEEEVHARHIFVKTKEEAQKIIDELNNGANFEKLARQYSKDGSAAVGGDLGYFSRGQMVKPFEDAAFSLKVGSYTKTPLETPFGWHVVKLEDKRLKRPPSLDDVHDTLRDLIIRERSQALLDDLSKKYHLEYPDQEISKYMKNNTNNDLPTDDGEDLD